MSDRTLETSEDEDAEDAPLDLSDDQIAAYLRHNADFLVRNPDILDGLDVPARWTGDGIVDMQQFMLERLRGEVDNLRDCTLELIDTSRRNMVSQGQIHAIVLAILGARDLNQFLRLVDEDMALMLDADSVVLAFEPPAEPLPALASPALRTLVPGTVDRRLGEDQDIALLREVNDDDTVFGEAAGLVRSAALMRITAGPPVPPGLLAVGVRSRGTFHPGQGTELLGFLRRVVERCLERWLTART